MTNDDLETEPQDQREEWCLPGTAATAESIPGLLYDSEAPQQQAPQQMKISAAPAPAPAPAGSRSWLRRAVGWPSQLWSALCCVLGWLSQLWPALLDIASASYFATEWHDSVINPEAPEVLQVVAKTRGKTQHYQNPTTFAFDLTWHDLQARKRPMFNPTREVSELEAAALNHALSVRRKTISTVGGAVFLTIGIILEAVGRDISILT